MVSRPNEEKILLKVLHYMPKYAKGPRLSAGNHSIYIVNGDGNHLK